MAQLLVNQDLGDFLRPLEIDTAKIHGLAKSLACTFARLAKESKEQFLSTPISDEVLRTKGDASGRYLAIDIGGTNLRVGFIELSAPYQSRLEHLLGGGNLSSDNTEPTKRSHVQRHLEKAWPIEEQLKNDKAEDLFSWVGSCIAEVIQDGLRLWGEELPDEIPLGVTFSFPMKQQTLADATLMSMGKGFAVASNSSLGKLLLNGYESKRDPSLPTIKITAIVNDSVATLVSFAYELRNDHQRKAAMGLIVGTGCNATIPLPLSRLHPSKRPVQVKVLDDTKPLGDPKITVNTEWTINGAAGPLHELNFVTPWDSLLDSQGELPGFQPFEYMTAGRYLGELGRLIIIDYFTNILQISTTSLPPALLKRNGLTTSFLGNIGPHLSTTEPSILKQVENELPASTEPNAFKWTQSTAGTVYTIAKSIQTRAAGMAAAAVIALLACAEEIHFSPLTPSSPPLANGHPSSPPSQAHSPPQTHNYTQPPTKTQDLMVGYTGGCIIHFQDYLTDCQQFLDDIMNREFGNEKVPRVLLSPCHDGGIVGAGILAATVDCLVLKH